MKKGFLSSTAFFILLFVMFIGFIALLFLLRGDEDTWIKNEKGEYVKHGVPYETPSYVSEQQQAVIEALQLYQQKKAEGMKFESQCLGIVAEGNYVVDIVHVPRTEEDNLEKNQCKEYIEGKASYFIELDKEGNIVRIV